MDLDVRAGALRIVEARRGDRLLPGLPGAERPRTLADGYRMQHAATALRGDRVAGWKVGATSAEVQRLFGVAEPVFGPVFAATVFGSPARLGWADFRHRLLEVEFAFRLGRDLPGRAEPYGRAEVLGAVDAVAPAFGIIDPRTERFATDDIPLLVADFAGDGGAVLGAPVEHGWDPTRCRATP